MSTAGKRSNTISTSLCNAIATYSWRYGIWYQVPYLDLFSVRVTIVLEAWVLGARQPCSPSTQGVPLPMLVMEGTLQSTIWHLKVCGVDSAIAQNRYLFHVFKLFYGVAKHAAAVQYEKLMSPWAPSARIFISKEDADSITDLVRLRSILRIAAS